MMTSSPPPPSDPLITSTRSWKIAASIGGLSVAFGVARSLPTWVIILFSPVWAVATVMGFLAVDIGLKWWFDERVTVAVKQRGRHTGRSGRIEWRDITSSRLEVKKEAAAMTSTQTSTAGSLLRGILTLIRRDYILPWFSRISGSSTFPDTLDNTTLHSITEIQTRFNRLDLPQLLVSRILPHLTAHMRAYRQVEPFLYPTTRNAYAHAQNSVDPAPILQSHRIPLHPALPASALANPMPSVEAHLRGRIEELLRLILPKEERGSETVVIIAREILACVVMVPVVDMLADPDFWNRMLDVQADKHLQERQQVTQLRAALENAASQPTTSLRQRASLPNLNSNPTTPVKTPRRPTQTISISIDTSSKSFDTFVKSIGKIRNVTEAKRLRNDIDREIRQVLGKLSTEREKEKSGLARVIGGDKGKSKEAAFDMKPLIAYLERLESARRKVDRRIDKLSGRSPGSEVAGPTEISRPHAEPSLRDILTNPSPLSFYMEFMDRRGESRLVQFWLTVESFKDPLLEDVESSDEDDTMTASRLSSSLRLDTASMATAKEDVSMVWSMFLDPAEVAEPVQLRSKLFQAIRDVCGSWEGGEEDKAIQRLAVEYARKCTFRAQRDIYQAMCEDHLPAFRKTDLYRKALVDLSKIEATRSSTDITRIDSLQDENEHNDALVSGSPVMPELSQSPNLMQSRWMSFSHQFPSFTKPRTGSTASRQSPTTGINRDAENGAPAISPMTTANPETPVPYQRFRRQSWSTHWPTHEQTPSPTDANMSKRALGFLIGDAEPAGEDGRSALFTIDDAADGADDQASIKSDGRLPDEDEEFVQVQRIEAIQAALTSIINKDDRSRGSTPAAEPRSRSSFDSLSSMASMTPEHAALADRRYDPLGVSPSEITSPTLAKSRPMLPALMSRMTGDAKRQTQTTPVVERTPASRPGEAEPLFGREDGQANAHSVLNQAQHQFDEASVHAVQPSGEQLQVAIRELGNQLIKLEAQDRILDKMIRAAELTGKNTELELLIRSQNDLRRETRTTRFRKMQFEQQENDARLDPQRTKVSIPTATILAEEVGKQIVRYVIKVEQFSPEGEYLHGWIVARRYNDFWDLQHTLKASRQTGADVRRSSLDLPSKKLLPKITEAFVESRRAALEQYIQSLLAIPSVCQHSALRAFLSEDTAASAHASKDGHRPPLPARPFSVDTPANAKSMYEQFTSSLDDIFLKPSMIEVVAERFNRQAIDMAEAWDTHVSQIGSYGLELGSAVLSPYALRALTSPSAPTATTGEGDSYPFPAAKAQSADSSGPSGLPVPSPHPKVVEETTFTAPISDFLVEIFGLKDGDWLRKQAVVIVMQQLLGSTIERKVRDVISAATSVLAFDKYMENLKTTMWPNGEKRTPSVPRTDSQKARSKVNAARKIQALIPDVAANMIGRNNAQRAARQTFGVAQIRLLNLHILLTIIDEVLTALTSEPAAPTHIATQRQA